MSNRARPARANPRSKRYPHRRAARPGGLCRTPWKERGSEPGRKGGEVFQQWLSIRTLEDEAGKPTNYVGMFTDISRMHHATSHLEHLAHYDALTGLPNRSLSDIRLTHTVETARRAGTLCALILIDLDGFKEVNDTMGHQAGTSYYSLWASAWDSDCGQRIRSHAGGAMSSRSLWQAFLSRAMRRESRKSSSSS